MAEGGVRRSLAAAEAPSEASSPGLATGAGQADSVSHQSRLLGVGNHPVARFLVRRFAAGIATLLVASFLIFLATNALPGNVAQVVLGKNASPALVSALDRKLHLTSHLNRRSTDHGRRWNVAPFF